MKFTTTMNKKDIETGIASVQRRGKKLDADIQCLAMSTAAHLEAHRDDTLVNRLMLALPKGSRKLALAEWFIQFGGLMVNTDKETMKERPLVNDKTKSFNAELGAETPWYECKKEADISSLDAVTQLKSLITRIKNAQNKGQEVELGGIDIAALEAMTVAKVVSESEEA